MESDQNFINAANEVAKYIIDYFDNLKSRKVYPNVKPGFMRHLIPQKAPEFADTWKDVFNDIEKVIMPGLCHWLHPNFVGYLPAQTSYAAILAEMLTDTFVNVVISWKSSPSATELEVIVLDWMAKAIGLPETFLSTSRGDGGGSIQGSTVECMILSLFAARTMYIHRLQEEDIEIDNGTAVSKLIAYKSTESHESLEKALRISLVKYRNIQLDDNRAISGDRLMEAIKEDKSKGLIPFYICATLGSTSMMAFDNILEIGPICVNEGIWMHIDASFVGNAFICPEYRHLLKGASYAESVCVSPHKWLHIPSSCAIIWLKHSSDIVEYCGVSPTYLHCPSMAGMPNYTNWQIQCGRPFRSLKLWFVLRLFGIKRLQEIVRNDIKLANCFKQLIKKDDRFELIGKNVMTLVCFRLKGSNALNKTLLEVINASREIYMDYSNMDDIMFLRFSANGFRTTLEDIQHCYEAIGKFAANVLNHTSVAV